MEVLRRIPFLLENFKTDPLEWNRRNRAAFKQVRLRVNLKVFDLLERHEEEILDSVHRMILAAATRNRLVSYRSAGPRFVQWHQRMALRHLMNSVRTRERGVFTTYCQDLAERRFERGFSAEEVCETLDIVGLACLESLGKDPEIAGFERELDDLITMTLRFGCDQVLDTFDELAVVRGPQRESEHTGR